MGCETRDHLFFECSFTRRIWRHGLAIPLVPEKLICWDEICAYLTPFALENNLKATILKHLLGASVYHIWVERNQRIFKQEAKTEDQITSTIFNEVRTRIIFGRKFPSNALNIALCKLWKLDEILG